VVVIESRPHNLDRPDEVITFPLIVGQLVEVGDLTIGKMVTQPGWRWSTNVRPTVGGQWCQARHLGLVLSGRLGILHSDGTQREFGPNDILDVPPGHDGWTIGDEPCVQIEWAGLRAFIGFPTGFRSRVLASLLMTDLVNSTELARRLGDGRWREVLSHHFEAARFELDRFGGREVKTTGDGLLATFDSPVRALHCASAIRRVARSDNLSIRACVHVGEVELVGSDVRGVTVHETARILAAAGGDEILVSNLTRALAEASGLSFEDHGIQRLKGLDGEWNLSAFTNP
jgi:hypothetical protein